MSLSLTLRQYESWRLLTILTAQDNVHVSLSSVLQYHSRVHELTCSFVAVLFIDALQRMVRIAQEGEQMEVTLIGR